MKLARKRTAALIVAACVMIGTASCGSGETPGSAAGASGTPGAAATSSKAPEPKEVLLSSLAAYEKSVYAADFAGREETGSAMVDAPRKQAYMKIVSAAESSTVTLEALAIEADTYVRVNVGEMTKMPGMQQFNGKLWMHLDRSKIKDPELRDLASDDGDTLGLTALLKSAQSVQQAGDRKYSGTLDLAAGSDLPIIDEAVVKALAGKAATVPFTATLDAEGRLTELLVDVPAAGATKPHQLKMTVTQYGTVTMPAKPTGKAVIEAPANVYDFVNG